MGYATPGLGDVSADTAATNALKLASRTVANANRYGTAAEQAAARQQLTTTAAQRTRDVARLKAVESAPTGPLAALQDLLTGAGKAAGIGIALITLVTAGPTILRMLESRSPKRRIGRGR